MPNWLNEFLTYAGTPEGERAIKVVLAILGVVGAAFLWSFGVIQKIRAALFGAKKDSATPQPTQQVRDNAHGGFAKASTGGVATGQVLGEQTIHQGAPVGHVTLTSEQFVTHLEKEREKAEAKLRDAHDSEKAQLRDKITELERQLANPDEALDVAKKTIADLTDRLERMGNEVGGDRLAEAREAMDRLDFSVADEIFADVEARQELAVQEAARAAFGRGEVAEAEFRTKDAAAHYARAARLGPDFMTLKKSAELARRISDPAVSVHSAALVAFCETHGTQEQLAFALDEHGRSKETDGDLAEAERLFRQALEISKATIGEAHPDYDDRLHRFAWVLWLRGELEEVERLYRQALEIGKATTGAAHPKYIGRLTNLAGVLLERGELAGAEGLYRQALEIHEAKLPRGFPNHTVLLHNFAYVLAAQGKLAEAETLCREVLEINKNMYGEKDSTYADDLSQLAFIMKAKGDLAEAELLFRQALEIAKATQDEGNFLNLAFLNPDYSPSWGLSVAAVA